MLLPPAMCNPAERGIYLCSRFPFPFYLCTDSYPLASYY